MAIEGVFLLPFVIATLMNRRVSPITLRVGSLILLGIVTFTLVIGIGHMVATLKNDLKGPALVLLSFIVSRAINII